MKFTSNDFRDETIWIVMKVTQASIPIAWRVTEAEAVAVQILLAKNAVAGEYYFVMPVTNEMSGGLDTNQE